MISVDIQNPLYTESWWHLFIYSIPTSISSKKYYGEECYYINNFQYPYTIYNDGMYINKKTGLLMSTTSYEVKYENGENGRWPMGEYLYEFDTVTEADFIEPNIDEYKIQENVN